MGPVVEGATYNITMETHADVDDEEADITIQTTVPPGKCLKKDD